MTIQFLAKQGIYCWEYRRRFCFIMEIREKVDVCVIGVVMIYEALVRINTAIKMSSAKVPA